VSSQLLRGGCRRSFRGFVRFALHCLDALLERNTFHHQATRRGGRRKVRQSRVPTVEKCL